MVFRKRVGDERFADLSFAQLQTDPVGTLESAYSKLGLTFSDATLRSVQQWAEGHKPGARGVHDYTLADYGLTPEQVRAGFAEYLAIYDATA